jgi:hypothetical protein
LLLFLARVRASPSHACALLRVRALPPEEGPSMRLLIDTTGMTFTVGSNFEPVTDYETKQPKTDRDTGAPLAQVQLICFYADGQGRPRSEILTVKVPDPKPVPAGSPVRVHELVANPWANNGRNGVAYRAAVIEPAAQAKAS